VVLVVASSASLARAQSSPAPVAGSGGADWSQVDVGIVGQQGSAQLNNGLSGDIFTVSGAGSDIWGTNDSFHFAYQPVSGDADIFMLVRSQSAANAFAKAGVMFRQTIQSSSPSVILDAKPDGGIEFMMRSSQGGTTRFLNGTTQSYPMWLRLTRNGGNVAAFVSSTSGCSPDTSICHGWTMLSNGWIPWTIGGALSGVAVTSHDSSTLNTAQIEVGQSTALGTPWQETDTYFENPPDNAYSPPSGGAMTVPGAGADIWGQEDQFKFVWVIEHASEAQIVTRATHSVRANAFAKAGVMMRADLGSSSANVILDVKPDGGIEFMQRASTGTRTTFLSGGFRPAPTWLKLVRSGATYTGYYSSNGTDWTFAGSTTIATADLPTDNYFMGLAVTSHQAGVPTFAFFDQTSMTNPATTSNLLQKPGFEEYTPPALGAPGWVADASRQTPAQSASTQPHTGKNHGECNTDQHLDCGLYQDIVAPFTGNYILTMSSNASRGGGLVGANVNGALAVSNGVAVNGFGAFGLHSMGLFAHAGDTIRVWMYSPATPGWVVIDDVSLTGTPAQ